MKYKYIFIMLNIFGNFLLGSDLNQISLHVLDCSFSDEDKEELLARIRLIGQPNGYKLESKISLGSKIIWFSPMNNPRVRYGYVKFWDIMENHKDFKDKSIFWKNKYLRQDSLEDDVDKAIDQNHVISDVVHCLRAAKISGSQVKYTDESSCSIQ